MLRFNASENGTAAADWVSYETNRPRVFAGGDLVCGASNVSATMATGKDAARAIDRLLSGGDRLARVLGAFDVDQRVPVDPEGGARQGSARLALQRRQTGDGEVLLGLTPPMACAESSRCLRCDVRQCGA